MTDRGLVAVIIPVYNAESTLKDAVDSVLSQTYQNIRIILVDDGAKDKSGAMCDEYVAEHANIAVVHKGNGGLSSARNAGLTLLNNEADWLVFLDADDMLLPDALENLLAKAIDDEADIVVTDKQIQWNDSTGEKWTVRAFTEDMFCSDPVKYVLNMMMGKHRAWGCHSSIYRMSVIAESEALFPEGCIAEDIMFNMQVYPFASKVSYSETPVMLYRRHEGSITATFHENYFENILYMDKCAEEFIKKTGDTAEARKKRDALLAANIVIYLFDIFSGKCNYNQKEKRKLAMSIIKDERGRGVLRKKNEQPWFESRVKMLGVSLCSALIRFRLYNISFLLMGLRG